MNKQLNIGLFGFGCVGQGLYHVLNNSTGFKANIRRIAVKNRNKPRSVAPGLITYDKWDILNDPSIDVVVELIDNAEEAWHIVREAMTKGKHVVTANKKLLALHLNELLELQKQYQVSLLYEGAVCASIPVLRTLEEYFDNEELEKVTGIFNGTTNYILTKTIREKLSYESALKDAQKKGFAESDPTSDVEGFDPKFKALILALHAFGVVIGPEQVLNIGITGLHEKDIQYAFEKGYAIKLTPVIRRVSPDRIGVFVAPQFVKNDSNLHTVENEFNAVIVEGRFSGEQFFQGRGAGSYPTGAAVLSDISALSYGYKYEYKKHRQANPPTFTNQLLLQVYLRYNNEADLERLQPENILERFDGTGHRYITGNIRLDILLKQANYIRQQQLFIALLSDKTELIKENDLQNNSKTEQHADPILA